MIRRAPGDHSQPAASLRRILQDTFGFEDFLPFQQEVIERTLNGEDLLVVLPTGSGKSL